MKAKDLAALAALGIAGKYAYDKYSEKNAPASGVSPPGAKLGNRVSPINEGTAGETENYSNEGRNAKFANEDYSNEGRNAKFANEDYSNEGRGKAAPDYSNEGRGKLAPVAVAKPVRREAVVARPLDSIGGPSRYNRAADSNAAGAVETGAVESDYQMPRTAPRTDLDRLNAANGAASESARQTDALAVGSRANQAAYLQAKQADQMAAAGSPSALATDALANTSRAAVLVDRANKLNPTAMQASGALTPSAKMTDKLATTSRANQAAYLAQQRAEQARIDALRSSGGARAKGGAVKMASGGLASSKMSKPSGASRGDGIAQRGRTRGKYL
jgi:hypothetical protein